ncbi:hypothetical protein, partial [Streptomyces griseoruber]|uniref:hypothetical protein n=1 Tax=Streptomyces griseoruber TaxID=1943 RepID=UPI0006E13145
MATFTTWAYVPPGARVGDGEGVGRALVRDGDGVALGDGDVVLGTGVGAGADTVVVTVTRGAVDGAAAAAPVGVPVSSEGTRTSHRGISAITATAAAEAMVNRRGSRRTGAVTPARGSWARSSLTYAVPPQGSSPSASAVRGASRSARCSS